VSSCILCGTETAIKNSHIISKLVGKRLKAGAAVKTLRNSLNPNVPAQDTWKDELLGPVCEQRFSAYEGKFAKDVYDPLRAGAVSVNYDESFYLFAASVHFRYLHFLLTKGRGTAPRGAAQLCADLKSACQRGTLDSVRFTLFAFHLWPVTPPSPYPPGINYYFAQVLDGFAFSWVIPPADETTVSNVKLESLLLVVTDREPTTFCTMPSIFDPHIIRPPGTLLANPAEPVAMGMFAPTLANRSIAVQDSLLSMSQAQRSKIEQEIKSNPNATKTRAHAAYVRDLALLNASMTTPRI